MGVDRYWEAQDALQECPAKLAAAEARIVELERERDEALELAANVNRERHELQAARADDEERVRSVVERAAAAVLGPNGPTCNDWSSAAAAIATRAAKQLATAAPVINDQERNHLTELLSECTVDDYPAARQAIERFLAARSSP
jgi:chromosome segregation ATPase